MDRIFRSTGLLQLVTFCWCADGRSLKLLDGTLPAILPTHKIMASTWQTIQHHNTEFIIHTCSLFFHFVIHSLKGKGRVVGWFVDGIYCILASFLLRIPPLKFPAVPCPPLRPSFPPSLPTSLPPSVPHSLAYLASSLPPSLPAAVQLNVHRVCMCVFGVLHWVGLLCSAKPCVALRQ